MNHDAPVFLIARFAGTKLLVKATSGPETLSSGSRLGSFVTNLLYGGLRGSVFFVNTLVVTPLLIFGLGKEQFAVLALATPMLRYGFNGVFDFGLATALARVVSRESASGHYRKINGYVASAVLLYAAGAVFALIVFRLISHFVLDSVVRLDGQPRNAAHAALTQLLMVYFLLLLSNPFFALLVGIQKIHVSHAVGTVSSIAELVGVLALLPFGITLSRVVLVYALAGILSVAFCIRMARHHFPMLKVRLRSASGGAMSELLHYTARWSVTVSVALITPIVDKLILARFVGLSYIAAYEAAAKLVDILRRTTQLLLLPLFPMAGATPTDSRRDLELPYERIVGTNLVINTGLYLIPATLGFAVMRRWLGSGLSHPAGWAFVVLTVTALVLAVAYPAVLISAGRGRLTTLVNAGLWAMGLNICLTPLLAKYFGFGGLLLGTVVVGCVQTLIILGTLQRQPAFALHAKHLLPLGLATVGAATIPGVLLGEFYGTELSAVMLIAFALANVVLYAAVVLAFGENRHVAASIAHQLRRLVRRRKRTPAAISPAAVV